MALVLFSFADNSRTTWHIGNPPKWYDSSDDILSETLSLDLHLIVEARESKQTSCRTDRQQLPNCNPNQMIVPGPTNQSHRYAFDRIWWDISEQLHSMFESSWLPKERSGCPWQQNDQFWESLNPSQFSVTRVPEKSWIIPMAMIRHWESFGADSSWIPTTIMHYYHIYTCLAVFCGKPLK